MRSNGNIKGGSMSAAGSVMVGGGTGRPRIAIISLHTSPRDQPGTGDSGGMNVYILEVADRLARQGVVVDIFTRHQGVGPDVEHLSPGARLLQVPAGPRGPVPKEELPVGAAAVPGRRPVHVRR